MKIPLLYVCVSVAAGRALVLPVVVPSSDNTAHGKAKPDSPYVSTLTAASAKWHIPNWPTLSSSQSNYEVMYFPQNPATANNFDMANMLCLVNKLRKTKGLYPLVYHDSLMQSAQTHAQFEANYRVVAHADESGHVGERLTALGYRWSMVAENVGAGTDSEADIVDAWTKSAGHLANMLHPDIRFMGVSVSSGFWAQDFASPLDKDTVVPREQVDACPSTNSLRIYS
ncbi:hypothetical protein GGH91_001152 [Coemansia sp. RSA 2671]|nr:hypothetical protein LPJ60_000053 [Coemansia sp. RSA 2675]KAJ2348865.1 hypothetical protein GGH91_001152 [Coemansia sp. RSA 2671]